MFSRLETSFVLTILAILLLFGLTIAVVVIAPNYVDSSWSEPSSDYQKQVYEVADPNLFIQPSTLQYVRKLKGQETLLSFEEEGDMRILAPKEFENCVTRHNEKPLRLTNKLLLLKEAEGVEIGQMRTSLQKEWEEKHPDWRDEGIQMPYFEILTLFDPEQEEVLAITDTEGNFEPWVDKEFVIEGEKRGYQNDPGVIYVKNPKQYGKRDLQGFYSRKELIQKGEEIFKIEGCWYCHTDQSRTLIEDCVLNGSDNFPAPPSSAHEYIYQEVTFPGTKRNGPDLARVGIKRPSRDWHKSHFWSPKTKSLGSIMPSFRHFFNEEREPNEKFEAIYQYLMTKGTRITPPNQAWWQGLDPVEVLKIIEGRKK